MRSDTAALAGLLALGLGACGGAPQAVRQTLSVTATAVAATDGRLAPRYSDAAEECLAEARTRSGYEHCMRDFDAATDALEASRSSLLALESTADAWDAGGEEDWPSLTSCVVIILTRLRDALAVVGVEVPEEAAQALSFLSGFGGQCRE